jgi:hypothetical protein
MSAKKHLEKSQTTYFNHAGWAIIAGIRLIAAGISSLIHAVYPGWFQGTAARTVIQLYHRRLSHHPNPEYQAYIKEQSQGKRPGQQ